MAGGEGELFQIGIGLAKRLGGAGGALAGGFGFLAKLAFAFGGLQRVNRLMAR